MSICLACRYLAPEGHRCPVPSAVRRRVTREHDPRCATRIEGKPVVCRGCDRPFLAHPEFSTLYCCATCPGRAR